MEYHWKIVNDDSNKDGMEFKYSVDERTLSVYVFETNSKFDWLRNFFFMPVPVEWFKKKGWMHIGYKREAIWLTAWIQGFTHLYNLMQEDEYETIEMVNLSGYSKGAGVIQDVHRELVFNTRMILSTRAIDGIISVLPKSKYMTMYYKKGGLYWLFRWIPLFRAYKEKCINDKFQPIWKAHRFSEEEIREIIEC